MGEARDAGDDVGGLEAEHDQEQADDEGDDDEAQRHRGRGAAEKIRQRGTVHAQGARLHARRPLAAEADRTLRRSGCEFKRRCAAALFTGG